MDTERSISHAGLMKEIGTKADNARQLAKSVAENNPLLSVVLEGVSSRETIVKFKCAKILKIMSEENPDVLYPHFDFFEELLDSANNPLRWNAIDILANLAAVDSENRFGRLFRRFYGLIEEGSLITAAHVVEGSPKVVQARPDWETEITQALLDTENAPLPTEECRGILRGKVITAFAQYVGQSGNKQAMLHFAGALLTDARPATREKAQRFLKTFDSGAAQNVNNTRRKRVRTGAID